MNDMVQIGMLASASLVASLIGGMLSSWVTVAVLKARLSWLKELYEQHEGDDQRRFAALEKADRLLSGELGVVANRVTRLEAIQGARR